jgi:filamentous hemagglutinin family protein
MMGALHSTKQTVFTPLCLLTGFTITCSLPFNSPAMPLGGGYAIAQIIPDNSLGSESSVVVPNVNINGINSDRIDGGAIRGTNLFHSFQEFNIDNGRGAYFTNPGNISNILTRVTGNNLSNILGTLGVLGNVNLFLINPNGIVFGPNARLDVGGSFFASTADSILFENGVEFAASNPESPPLLTINIPIGLRLRENQPAIENSVLLPPETVRLVGEDVNIVENTEIEPGSTGLILTNAEFLENLSGNQNVIVQATNDITVRDLTDNVLEFQHGNGAIVFNADVEGDGVGSFVMEDITVENPQALINNEADTLKTNGRDISISGASLTLGNIDASGIDRSETPADNAGQLLETAQIVSSEPGVELTTISGTINIPGDVDLFQIYITGDETFSAGLDFTGAPLFDFRLYLFDANGVGISSTITSFLNFPSPEPGIYYLAVSNFDAFSQEGVIPIGQEGAIFSGSSPSSTLPLIGWEGEGSSIGTYVLSLTGVQAPKIGAIESALTTIISDPGGVINLSATHGDLNTTNLISGSFATWGNTSNGGNITLNADNGSIVTGIIDSSSRTNIGRARSAGEVILNASQDITVRSILTNVIERENSFGAFPTLFTKGGDISLITTFGDILIEEDELNSSYFNGDAGNISFSTLSGNISIEKNVGLDTTSTNGNGGNISFNTTSGNISTGESISISSISILDTGSVRGNSGNINFDTTSGNISTGEGRLYTGSVRGNSGNINFNTTSGDIFIGEGGLAANADGFFGSNSGNINIYSISGNILTEGSLSTRIFRFSDSTDSSNTQGGNISLTTMFGNISIGSNSSFTASARGLLAGSMDGRGGDITLSALSGSITAIGLGELGDGRETSFDSNGQSSQSSITFEAANDILITDRSIDFSGSGDGGNIQIRSESGVVRLDNVLVSGDATDDGNGSDISISARSVELTDTDLSTTVVGRGNAGNISIDASNSIFLDFSRLSTFLELGAEGRSGNIDLKSNLISLENNSLIDTAIFGRGEAGNVTLQANSVFLDNSSILNITGGESRAGDVNILAENSVVLSNRSNISTASVTSRSADAGNINVQADSLIATGGSQLQALTRGVGNAGQVNLNVTNSIVFSGVGTDGFLSGAFTSSSADNSGQGGDININTSQFRIEDGAVLSAQTSSLQPGGDIVLSANRIELLSGGQLRTDTSGSGQAGNIVVMATEGIFVTGFDPNFDLRPTPPPPIRDNVEIKNPDLIEEGELSNFPENPQILLIDDANFSIAPANTNPNVEFSSRIPYISIQGNLFLNEEFNTVSGDVYTFEVTAGTRGFFDIDTGSNLITSNTFFVLTDSQDNPLTSTADDPAFLGGSGSIPLNESTVDSIDPYIRLTFQEAGAYFIAVRGDRTEGNIPYTLNISLESPNIAGSVIETEAASGMFARTSGTGAAGNITLNTPQLSVTDGAQISTTATATASRTEPSGNLTINANQINLSGNSGLSTNIPSSLSSETQGVAPAGTLILKPYTQPNLTVQLRDHAAISTSTSGSGAGGDLTITAPHAITLSGNGRIAAESSNLGQGGNIRIETETLRILEGIDITASSTGTGAAGSVEINSNFLELNNSNLSAETAAGDQGNITLTTSDLRLGNNSSITTNATGEATGGNITINTETLTALENSDISANAEDAFGGRITINAAGIFGTAFRTQQTQFSDITATSELGPEFSGTVELNTELDPSSGLIDLSQTVVDPNDLIAQEFCRQRGGSEFIVTGKGGIAADPNDKADGNQIEVDLVEPVPSRPRNSSQRRSETEDNQPISSLDLVPARGWIRDENGDVILVGYDPTKTGVRRQSMQHPQCQP